MDKDALKVTASRIWVQKVQGHIYTTFRILSGPYYWKGKWWVTVSQTRKSRPQVHTCSWLVSVAEKME